MDNINSQLEDSQHKIILRVVKTTTAKATKIFNAQKSKTQANEEQFSKLTQSIIDEAEKIKSLSDLYAFCSFVKNKIDEIPSENKKLKGKCQGLRLGARRRIKELIPAINLEDDPSSMLTIAHTPFESFLSDLEEATIKINDELRAHCIDYTIALKDENYESAKQIFAKILEILERNIWRADKADKDLEDQNKIIDDLRRKLEEKSGNERDLKQKLGTTEASLQDKIAIEQASEHEKRQLEIELANAKAQIEQLKGDLAAAKPAASNNITPDGSIAKKHQPQEEKKRIEGLPFTVEFTTIQEKQIKKIEKKFEALKGKGRKTIAQIFPHDGTKHEVADYENLVKKLNNGSFLPSIKKALAVLGALRAGDEFKSRPLDMVAFAATAKSTNKVKKIAAGLGPETLKLTKPLVEIAIMGKINPEFQLVHRGAPKSKEGQNSTLSSLGQIASQIWTAELIENKKLTIDQLARVHEYAQQRDQHA